MIEVTLRCPICGYTKEDALIHMDHSLCKGKIPEGITKKDAKLQKTEQKYQVCKRAAKYLAFACDAVDDYLNEFPNCETKPALIRLTRDMKDLSYFIERKPLTWKEYKL